MYRSHNTESCGVHVEVNKRLQKMIIRINFCLLWSTQIHKQPEVEKASVFLQPRLVCCDAWVAWWHPSRSDSLRPTGNNRQKELMEGPRWRQNPVIILYFLPLGQDVWKPCCIKASNSSQSNVCTVDLYQACVSTVFRPPFCRGNWRGGSII